MAAVSRQSSQAICASLISYQATVMRGWAPMRCHHKAHPSSSSPHLQSPDLPRSSSSTCQVNGEIFLKYYSQHSCKRPKNSNSADREPKPRAPMSQSARCSSDDCDNWAATGRNYCASCLDSMSTNQHSYHVTSRSWSSYVYRSRVRRQD
jgi:hypothetical protein